MSQSEEFCFKEHVPLFAAQNQTQCLVWSGLVWTGLEMGFHYGCDRLGAVNNHFRHGDTQPNIPGVQVIQEQACS